MRALILLLAAAPLFTQDITAGRRTFETRCGTCHGADGNGGDMAPSILFRLPTRDDQQLATLVREGLPDRGMPAVRVTDTELSDLIRFLRTIQRRGGRPLERRTVQMTTGKTLEGLVLGEGFDDLQRRSG